MSISNIIKQPLKMLIFVKLYRLSKVILSIVQ